MYYKGVGGDFWSDGYVCYLDCVDGFISTELTKLYFLKMCGWVVIISIRTDREEERGSGRKRWREEETNPRTCHDVQSLICSRAPL